MINLTLSMSPTSNNEMKMINKHLGNKKEMRMEMQKNKETKQKTKKNPGKIIERKKN